MYKYGVSPIFSLPFALNGGAVDREQACRTMTTATPCYEYGTAVRRICHPPRSVYQHYMLILNKLDKSPQNSLICALGTFILKRRPSRTHFSFAFLYKNRKGAPPQTPHRAIPSPRRNWGAARHGSIAPWALPKMGHTRKSPNKFGILLAYCIKFSRSAEKMAFLYPRLLEFFVPLQL